MKMAAPITTCKEMQQDSESSNAKPVVSGEIKLSKNQLKKQLKREKWLAIKSEKRRHIKEKRKQRLAERREKGEDVGPTRKSLKSNSMKNSSCKIRVVIDLSLDQYMTEKDINSLTCQLQHSYSSNRRAQNPLQLYLCGFCGKTKKRMDEIGDYKGWDVYVETRDYNEVFPKEDLVYLSSESPNLLTTLSEDKVYIIGGLVDHNQHKGLCHRQAEEKGIAHAQLPISEYLSLNSRKVLAVNHVFSILLRYTETQDWKKAFLAEMPQRKRAQLRDGEQSGFSKKSEDSDSSNSTAKKPCVGEKYETLDKSKTSSLNEEPATTEERREMSEEELNHESSEKYEPVSVDGKEVTLNNLGDGLSDR